MQIAKETYNDSLVLVEQSLNFIRWAAESFGISDCIIVTDGVITVIEFKYGLGVLIKVENNSQIRMLPPVLSTCLSCCMTSRPSV